VSFVASCDKEIEQEIRNEKRKDWLAKGVFLLAFAALSLVMVMSLDSPGGTAAGACVACVGLYLVYLLGGDQDKR
jgi:peptidoglycan/LPS O-acetylase OafA/YrhL